MKRLIVIIMVLLLVLSVTGFAQELVLYGSAEPRSIEVLAQGFEKATGIKVAWIRMSSGETLARLRAEKNNPQADVWWGGTTDPHSIAAVEGLTVPYKPKTWNDLDPRFRDPIGGARVIGVYVGILGLAVNEGVLKSMNLPIPTGWDDLLNPKYKGLIGMANPNTSGTALTMLCTQVFLRGEDKAFDYMKKLHKNIANYTKSGVAPSILAGRGEIAIAVAFLHDVIYEIQEGYPLKAIAPKEGTGYEIGGLNLVKGGPHPELGKKFMDWVTTPKAQESEATVGSYQLPTNIKAKVPSVSIPIDSVKTVNYNFKWVAENGPRLMDRWTREVFTLPR